jgi:hypothetical protein
LSVLRGKIAEADIHDAGVGVGCTTHFGGFQRPICEVPHHEIKSDESKTSAAKQTAENILFCHSERSEESLFDFKWRTKKQREILRFAHNDSVLSFPQSNAVRYGNKERPG